MKKHRVSPAVIRRLPRYYRRLTDMQRAGVERISSSTLAESLGLTASQIRQDLSCFGEFGQQGYGYNVESLRAAIAQILGLDRGHTAIIMGAGKLGQALIESFQFSQNGFQLLAAFDVDPNLVGTTVAGTPVLHNDQLEEFAAQNPVSIGVLTVPKPVAVETADRLVRLGVKGIWNFTTQKLTISDPSVKVEKIHFGDSLLALSYMISEEE
ncbi:MAG: redox-sensing transcriptional repressor Rex [Oscillospiraceae bacterium]